MDPTTRNQVICEIFQQLLEDRRQKGQEYRARSYINAIDILSQLDHPIGSGNDAKSHSGIGAGLAKKIQEIIDTGKLQELEDLKAQVQPIHQPALNEKQKAINLFKQVHGVGPVKAKQWYAAGYRELSDVPIESCTHAQQCGIIFFNEYTQRIPRQETMMVEKVLKEWVEVVNQHHGVDSAKDEPVIRLEICGSYRRRTPDSGDIDVMVTHRCTSNEEVMKYLLSCPILKYALSQGKKKFLGLCKAKELHRRIDIELVSPEQYPYALLYFTGSKEHNILMRSKAAEKGWRLNEKEMYVIESGDRITVKDEKEIFSLLGVPYKEAWER